MQSMVKTRVLSAPMLAAVLFASLATGARADECAALAATKLQDAVIRTAEMQRAAPMTVRVFPGAAPQTVQLPAFCRVNGVASGSIGFDVWLPAQGWNLRLLSVGNGGFGGEIQLAALADGLSKGYAVTSNDTGHQGSDRAWMRDPARVRLWGHSATHLVTGPAKAIVRAYYGSPARYAYFAGCSTGGAQAMEEAEFYPADYDGIVAGAPGMSYAHLMLSFLWGLKAADRPGGALPLAKLKLLNRAVLDACDHLDGARDGLISDPLACHFDVRRLTCAGSDTAACLTPAQVKTALLIYQGPHNPRTGARIYPGFVFGSEADQESDAQRARFYGWGGIQGPLAQSFAIPLLQDMVYHNPAWDWRSFDWDKDVADLDHRIGADITAMNPDLAEFAHRRGKLIIYQGWGDPLNAQTLPIAYRADVIDVFARQAGVEKAAGAVDGFMRVFMVPGMGHCSGGTGPDHFDALGAVRRWAETGRPPERMIASTDEAGKAPAKTRPICAYPASPHWNGRGSMWDAANFACIPARGDERPGN